MNLSSAEHGKEYIIRTIETDDEEMDAFLFSLGCYSGEPITVVSRRRGSCTRVRSSCSAQSVNFSPTAT